MIIHCVFWLSLSFAHKSKQTRAVDKMPISELGSSQTENDRSSATSSSWEMCNDLLQKAGVGEFWKTSEPGMFSVAVSGQIQWQTQMAIIQCHSRESISRGGSFPAEPCIRVFWFWGLRGTCQTKSLFTQSRPCFPNNSHLHAQLTPWTEGSCTRACTGAEAWEFETVFVGLNGRASH